MVSFTGKRGKPGRPRGQQHDAEVHVRLPREVLKMLNELARQERVSVSQAVRIMIAAGLINLIGQAGAVVMDDQTTAWQRLRAISRNRQLRWALLHLTDAGPKLARAKVLERARRS